jgi:hypothetical protein
MVLPGTPPTVSPRVGDSAYVDVRIDRAVWRRDRSVTTRQVAVQTDKEFIVTTATHITSKHVVHLSRRTLIEILTCVTLLAAITVLTLALIAASTHNASRVASQSTTTPVSVSCNPSRVVHPC